MGPREDGQIQIHDFNPGDLNEADKPNWFMDGGLFWTSRVPTESVQVDLDNGDASFVLSDFSMLDYFDVGNAIFRMGPSPVPASASVDIQWAGTGERAEVRDDAKDFAGQYANAGASVQWSAAANGYAFSTVNSSETNVAHAFIARLRTGSFHRG